MKRTKETPREVATIDRIMRIERRIHGTKGDIEGLFENYVSDLIVLKELRTTLATEMVDDAFPPSLDDIPPTVRENCNVE